MSIPDLKKPVLSPCTGICALGIDGKCAGCFRTGDEIASWISMSDTERERLIDHVLPQRAGSSWRP